MEILEMIFIKGGYWYFGKHLACYVKAFFGGISHFSVTALVSFVLFSTYFD
jgi:hypothetical protein